MKDEHYYQRLTQIRQKYGYFNESNSYQYSKRSPPRRLDTKQIYQPTNQNLLAPKSTKSSHPDDHLSDYYDRVDTKRYNEKTLNLGLQLISIPTKNTSQSIKTELFLQSNKRIINREKQNQISSKIPVKRCIPSPSVKYQEETSPIRNLQGMFAKNQQNDNSISQSPAIRAFSPRNIPNFQRVQHQLEDKFLNTDRIITKIGMQTQNRCQTPTHKREPLKQQSNNIKTLTNDAKNIENKYNTNIQNIDKIQGKIQAALNKSKGLK